MKEAKTCAEMTHDEILVGKWVPLKFYQNQLQIQQESFSKQISYLKEDIKRLEGCLAATTKTINEFPVSLYQTMGNIEPISTTWHSDEAQKWLERLRVALCGVPSAVTGET